MHILRILEGGVHWCLVRAFLLGCTTTSEQVRMGAGGGGREIGQAILPRETQSALQELTSPFFINKGLLRPS